jgi:MoaA/NifB/PqqE/SkfB family radical SAM enzyme
MSSDMADYIVRIAESAPEKIASATISGGEALLHPQVAAIAKRVRTISPRLTLSTNALRLSPDVSETLVCAGVTKFRIDVDPYRMLGRRWNPAGLDCKSLGNARATAARFGASVELNSVLTAYTLEQLVKLVSFCAKERVNAKFFERVLAGPDGRLYSAPDNPREMLEGAIDGVSGSFAVMPQDGTGDRVYSFQGISLRYCEFLCRYRRCGFSGTRIDPDGYVSSCINSSPRDRISHLDPVGISKLRIARAVERGCMSCNQVRKSE